ncbi:hypothetical protein FOL47_002216 [Perkinsus chesapeaki]|uniref:Uncharacterized protein n=1 Tax=Perkinsus chesapeaki TaxID=330153 RepID=A0A7J6MES9_PERCH|nr:hypothetical protein FOL47_002216 [Perkinsus chesapeaki]
MPGSGTYAGQNEKYCFYWVVRETGRDGTNGRVDIHASRLDIPGAKNISCTNVWYWQSSVATKRTVDFNSQNEGLIALSEKLGIDAEDWRAFSHGLHWIVAFGVRLTPI